MITASFVDGKKYTEISWAEILKGLPKRKSESVCVHGLLSELLAEDVGRVIRFSIQPETRDYQKINEVTNTGTPIIVVRYTTTSERPELRLLEQVLLENSPVTVYGKFIPYKDKDIIGLIRSDRLGFR